MSSQTQPKEKSGWENIEGFASLLGKWSWLILLIEGIIFIILGIYWLYWASYATSLAQTYGVWGYVAEDIAYLTFIYVMDIIAGIVAIVVTLLLVKPRFSNKWGNKDYDYLLNDVIKIGKYRIPLMLILGIILEILLQWWGGLIIIVPLLLLIFIGPKEYKWKE